MSGTTLEADFSLAPTEMISLRNVFQKPRRASFVAYMGTRPTSIVSGGGGDVVIRQSPMRRLNQEQPFHRLALEVGAADIAGSQSHEAQRNNKCCVSQSHMGLPIRTPVAFSRSPRKTKRDFKASGTSRPPPPGAPQVLIPIHFDTLHRMWQVAFIRKLVAGLHQRVGLH